MKFDAWPDIHEINPSAASASFGTKSSGGISAVGERGSKEPATVTDTVEEAGEGGGTGSEGKEAELSEEVDLTGRCSKGCKKGQSA